MSSYGTIVGLVICRTYGTIVGLMSSLLDLSLLLICYLLILVDYCLLKIGEILLKYCQNFIEFIIFDKCISNFSQNYVLKSFKKPKVSLYIALIENKTKFTIIQKTGLNLQRAYMSFNTVKVT
jgi:hypothetical protein